MNETALTNLLKKKSKWFPFSNCNNSGNVAESSSYREGSMMHSVANFFLWFLVFPFLSRQRGQKAIYHEDSWQWIFARAAMCSPASIWSEWKRRENMFPVLPLRHSAAAADRYSTLLSFSSSLLLLFLHVSSFFLFIYFFVCPLLSFRLSRLPVGHSSDFWLHMTAVTVPKMMARAFASRVKWSFWGQYDLNTKLKVSLKCELCKSSVQNKDKLKSHQVHV